MAPQSGRKRCKVKATVKVYPLLEIECDTGNESYNDNDDGITDAQEATSVVPLEMLKQRLLGGTAPVNAEEVTAQLDRMLGDDPDPDRAIGYINYLRSAVDEDMLAKRRMLERLTEHVARSGVFQLSIAHLMTPGILKKQLNAVLSNGTLAQRDAMNGVAKVHQLIADSGMARLDGKTKTADRNWRLLGTLANRSSTASTFFDRLQWGYSRVEEDRRKKHAQWTQSLVIKYTHMMAAVCSFRVGGALTLGQYSTPFLSEAHYDIPENGLGPFMLRRDLSPARKGEQSCVFATVRDDPDAIAKTAIIPINMNTSHNSQMFDKKSTSSSSDRSFISKVASGTSNGKPSLNPYKREPTTATPGPNGKLKEVVGIFSRSTETIVKREKDRILTNVTTEIPQSQGFAKDPDVASRKPVQSRLMMEGKMMEPSKKRQRDECDSLPPQPCKRIKIEASQQKAFQPRMIVWTAGAGYS